MGLRTVNTKLKTSIIMAGLSQYKVGEISRIHETRISQIIHGRAKPSDDEKKRISIALGVDVAELFPEEEV